MPTCAIAKDRHPHHCEFTLDIPAEAARAPDFIAVGLIQLDDYLLGAARNIREHPKVWTPSELCSKFVKAKIGGTDKPPGFAFSPGNSENSADSIGFHSNDGSVIAATRDGRTKDVHSFEELIWWGDGGSKLAGG